MTIKEIETRSGMTRANIRFYEAQGLLEPERRMNGYREYTEEDLEILKKIKLLRALHISLEEIKLLQAGERELMEVLNRHIHELQQEKKDIEQSQKICRVMQEDGARYQTLDAQHYLDVMKQDDYPLSFEYDIVPKVYAPWRRYFARALDGTLYTVVWNIVLALVFNVNIVAWDESLWARLLDTIVTLLMMFLFEPVLLSVFGTTIGKALLGLHVTDMEGRKMTYSKARERTRGVLLYGMGCRLPIYGLFRLWKSYKSYGAEETLEWEYGSEITLKDEKGWRAAAWIAVHVCLFGLLILVQGIAEMPKNRGDITVAEFCENYNRLSDYFGIGRGSHLDAQGDWITNGNAGGVVIYPSEHYLPDFSFTETDGIMTGMQFSIHLQGGDKWLSGNQNEMILAILAFVRAQKGSGLFGDEVKKIISAIPEGPYESFEFSAYGVDVVCDIDCSGYQNSGGILIPMENAETNYSVSFVMQKR